MAAERPAQADYPGPHGATRFLTAIAEWETETGRRWADGMDCGIASHNHLSQDAARRCERDQDYRSR